MNELFIILSISRFVRREREMVLGSPSALHSSSIWFRCHNISQATAEQKMVYCKIKKRLLKTRASKINHMSCYSFSVLYIVFVTHLRTGWNKRMSLKDKTASKIVIKTSLSCRHKIHSLPSLTSLICIIISCNYRLCFEFLFPLMSVCSSDPRISHLATRCVKN